MKTIRYGSSGEDVKNLQTALNRAGYKLDIDGQFGNKTLSAVKDFQSKNGLTVDGICGDNTWGALNKNSYAQLGESICECLNDIENLPSFKKVMELI